MALTIIGEVKSPGDFDDLNAMPLFRLRRLLER